MAEEVQEIQRGVFLNRRNVSGPVTEPGELDFIEDLKRSDGTPIRVVQRIPLPADMFTPERIEILIERIPDIEPGASVPVRFEIRGGQLYQGDQIIIGFTKIPNPAPSDFEPPRISLPHDRRDFVFRSQVSDASDTCVIGIKVVDGRGNILGAKASDPFKIRPAVPKVFTINPIPAELEQGQEIEVSFIFSHPTPIVKFRTFLTSVTPRITQELPEVAGNERRFLFKVPNDVEGEQFRISLMAQDYSAKSLLPVGKSNPFAIRRRARTSPPPGGIDLKLLQPRRDQELQAGATIKINWQIEPLELRSNLSIGYALQRQNAAYTLIETKENAQGVGESSWTIPLEIPDNTLVFIQLFLPRERLQRFFGPFSIRNRGTTPPPSGITLDLWQPRRGQRLQAGTRIELHWKIEPSTLVSDLSAGYALQRADGTYEHIETKHNVQDRGVTNWPIPLEIPENTEVFIKLKLEREGLYSQPFGPFFIVGGRRPGVPDTEGENPTEELSMLEQLLKKGLSLPKRGFFAFRSNRTLNVAQFASEVIYSQQSELRKEIQTKIPTVIGRLEALKTELDRENYAARDATTGRIYAEFMELFTQIETGKRHFLQLNDRERMQQLRDMGSYCLEQIKANAEFETLFDQNFRPGLKSHDWDRIAIDPNKLAFLFVRKDVHKVSTITHLYKFFDIYYDKLILLDGLFNKIKRTLTEMRKSIASS